MNKNQIIMMMIAAFIALGLLALLKTFPDEVTKVVRHYFVPNILKEKK